MKDLKIFRTAGTALLATLALTVPAFAQDAEPVVEAVVGGVPEEVGFILTTFMFLVTGFLVMWMAAASPCSKPALCAARTCPCSF